MFFFYILQSLKTDRFYIGHAENLQRRFLQHNTGRSKSTKSGIPWKIAHHEEFQTRSEAMKREKEIKLKKSRLYILKLIVREK